MKLFAKSPARCGKTAKQLKEFLQKCEPRLFDQSGEHPLKKSRMMVVTSGTNSLFFYAL
jgi:hypothetical protein